KAAQPATTLWFWNTEIGWATVHPLLAEQGWEYVQTIVWDKGIAHIAGNVNGDTIRQFPVVAGTTNTFSRVGVPHTTWSSAHAAITSWISLPSSLLRLSLNRPVISVERTCQAFTSRPWSVCSPSAF